VCPSAIGAGTSDRLTGRDFDRAQVELLCGAGTHPWSFAGRPGVNWSDWSCDFRVVFICFIKENLHGEAPNHQALGSLGFTSASGRLRVLRCRKLMAAVQKICFYELSCVVTVISQLLLVLARAALA
jgi:hypothetical protein